MIRVHEPDKEYDNQVFIQDQVKTFDVPYHTRYKKIKKTTRKVESQGLDAGEIEEQVDMKSIEFIRFDPDMDWLCVKIYSQQDFQWTSQLMGDKDVIAQYEAIEALGNMPSQATAMTLAKVIPEIKLNYHVRVAATLALAKCAVPEHLDWLGVKLLIRWYRDMFCFNIPDPRIPGGNAMIPRGNDFSVLQEYFVQRGIIRAISLFPLLVLKTNPCVFGVRRLLLDLLEMNDNSQNTVWVLCE